MYRAYNEMRRFPSSEMHAHMRLPPVALATTVAATLASMLATLAPASASAQRAPSTASAAPCAHATTACERWVVFGAGPARSMVYASYPLDRVNPRITRALVMVHGALRNADHYFETAMAAAFLAKAMDNTIVIAPRFAAGHDSVAPNEIRWPSARGNWRAGATFPNDPSLSSFALVDEIVRRLADRGNFPNLKQVVITGHSAGGQFTTRYEMANRIDGTVPVAMSYVVANPSSYAWPVALRPLPVGDANPATAANEALGDDGEKVHTNFTYAPFDSTRAPDFDVWPAGLDSLTGYAASESPAQLRRQLAARHTTYLLGQVDVLPLGGFDSSPSAMAQGPTRRARGEAFAKFVADSLGGHPKVIIVPECGHNDRCIYTTDEVFPAIFP
jgi:pimeloyl-ACP methyl ester carboxylesterase